jgi:DNA repair protein RadA/Sms
MAKMKTAYVCSDCGSEYSKWQGQCRDCGAWNTLSEIKLGPTKTAKDTQFKGYDGGVASDIKTLDEIDLQDLPRFSAGTGEFDRVLGGGLVPGSAILIGGNPGAGKSTLLLQTMCYLAESRSALYVTGEESLQQVAMRAQRLALPTARLNMLSETNVQSICAKAQQLKPKVLVVDSIQAVHSDEITSAPGRLPAHDQTRQCPQRTEVAPAGLFHPGFLYRWQHPRHNL